MKKKIVVAFGTNDGKKLIDEHVGESKYFDIYKFTKKRDEFLERRENIKYEEKQHGDPEKAKKVSKVLKGIDVIVGKAFGPNIIRMKKKYVCVVFRGDKIEKAKTEVHKIFDEIVKELEKPKGEEKKHFVVESEN